MQQLLDVATAFTALVVVEDPGCFNVNGVGDPWALVHFTGYDSHFTRAASRQGDVSLIRKCLFAK